MIKRLKLAACVLLNRRISELAGAAVMVNKAMANGRVSCTARLMMLDGTVRVVKYRLVAYTEEAD
ncbi:MAG: hypothetical protein CME72_11720 [Halomonadaceae bacterium]|nr:hypothetical protein [Halomonadaceae bacterium]